MRTWAKASAPAALLAVAVMSFGGGTALADTSGDGSIGGGNQVNLPISLPIDISGNSVAAVGESSASSRWRRVGGRHQPGRRHPQPDLRQRTASLGGNQINAPISAPINACGNAVSLVGSSDAGCKGGATVRKSGRGGSGGNRTSGESQRARRQPGHRADQRADQRLRQRGGDLRRCDGGLQGRRLGP